MSRNTNNKQNALSRTLQRFQNPKLPREQLSNLLKAHPFWKLIKNPIAEMYYTDLPKGLDIRTQERDTKRPGSTTQSFQNAVTFSTTSETLMWITGGQELQTLKSQASFGATLTTFYSSSANARLETQVDVAPDGIRILVKGLPQPAPERRAPAIRIHVSCSAL
jgi:hypothetical protein